MPNHGGTYVARSYHLVIQPNARAPVNGPQLYDGPNRSASETEVFHEVPPYKRLFFPFLRCSFATVEQKTDPATNLDDGSSFPLNLNSASLLLPESGSDSRRPTLGNLHLVSVLVTKNVWNSGGHPKSNLSNSEVTALSANCANPSGRGH